MKKILLVLFMLLSYLIVSNGYAELEFLDTGTANLSVGSTAPVTTAGIDLGLDNGSWNLWGTVYSGAAMDLTYHSLSHHFIVGEVSSPITALVINQNGFVGINKATPSFSLDVNGDMKINGNLDATELKVNILKRQDGSVFFNPTACPANKVITNISASGTVTCTAGSGTGDLHGPGGAIDRSLAVYADATGKVIRDNPQITVAPRGNLVIDSSDYRKITLSDTDGTAPHTVLLNDNVGFRVHESGVGTLFEVLPSAAPAGHTMKVMGDLDLQTSEIAETISVNNVDAITYDGTIYTFGAGATSNYFPTNVGIDNINPTNSLDVNGNINASQLCTGSTCISGWGIADGIADAHLDMNDFEIQNLRSLQLKDWDDDTGGADGEHEMLARDGAIHFFGGGVVVGNYADGIWSSDIPDGRLYVQSRMGIGDTAPLSGDLAVNGNVNVTGNLQMNRFWVDNNEPIRIVAIYGVGTRCTEVRGMQATSGFSENDWWCEPMSFQFYTGDIQEDGSGDPMFAFTCTKNGKWYLSYDFRSSSSEGYYGRVACFNKALVGYEGGTNGGGIFNESMKPPSCPEFAGGLAGSC